jgi:hypothetical protein
MFKAPQSPTHADEEPFFKKNIQPLLRRDAGYFFERHV